MSAIAPTFAPLAVRPQVAARKSIRGAPVASKASTARVTVSKSVVCQSERKESNVVEKVSASMTAAAVALAATPELARADEVTPSLNALLGSVAAGGVVLGAIAVGVVFVSQFDQKAATLRFKEQEHTM